MELELHTISTPVFTLTPVYGDFHHKLTAIKAEPAISAKTPINCYFCLVLTSFETFSAWFFSHVYPFLFFMREVLFSNKVYVARFLNPEMVICSCAGSCVYPVPVYLFY